MTIYGFATRIRTV